MNDQSVSLPYYLVCPILFTRYLLQTRICVYIRWSAFHSKVRHFVVIRNAVNFDSRSSSDMSNSMPPLHGENAQFLCGLMANKRSSCTQQSCEFLRYCVQRLNHFSLDARSSFRSPFQNQLCGSRQKVEVWI